MNNPNENHQITKLLEKIDFSKGILSIWGEIGVGKTILALQLAIKFSQLEKKTIFVYTKNRFPANKFKNLMQKNSQHLKDNLSFVEIHDFDELLEYILNIEFAILDSPGQFQKDKTQIGSILIDSALDLYSLKMDLANKKKNVELNYKLNQILATLTQLNNTYGIKIVLTNYPDTKQEEDTGEFFINERGGKVLEYWVTYSLQIVRTQNMSERKFKLRSRSKEILNELNVKLESIGFKILS